MPLLRVIQVEPTPDNSGPTYGRSGFYIHGASATHPELSSDGCVIAPRAIRRAIDAAYPTGSLMRTLLVVA